MEEEQLKKLLVGQCVEGRFNKVLCSHRAASLLAECLTVDWEGKVAGLLDFSNDLFLKHPKYIGRKDVERLWETPTAAFAVAQQIVETDESQWSDVFCYRKGFYRIVDVKSRRQGSTMPMPSILSAFKMAQLCSYILENEEYDTLCMDYVDVEWHEDVGRGVVTCEDVHLASLFRTVPSKLCVNHQQQIQFECRTLDQSWQGSVKEWAHEYMRHFVESASDATMFV